MQDDYKGGQVVIVGGGPAGLAAALMLAKRGWNNITLLEKRSSAQFYEPEKSYAYLVDNRGQQFTDYMDFTDELSVIGVPSSQARFNRVQSDGKISQVPLPSTGLKDSYWLSRKFILEIMFNLLQQQYENNVTTNYGVNVVELNISDEHEKIEISYQDDQGQIQTLNPTLLIGCDGANSIVQKKLQEQSKNQKFALKEFPSPATGLRFKILTVPQDFIFNKQTGQYTQTNQAYSIQGVKNSQKYYIKMGCLPFKNQKSSPRTANFIAKPDHHIWTLKTGEQLLNYLQEQFPLVPIKEQISLEELDRFAKSQGGTFPPPTYSDGIQMQFGSKGVVLLGDAMHFFPPDLGQGVNSAFEDVIVLKNALEKCDDNIVHALPLFEKMRIEDSKSLVKLVQTLAPYQYGQDNIKQQIWFASLLIQILAYKFLPQIFQKTTFFSMGNPEYSYTQLWNSKDSNLNKIGYVGLVIGVTLVASGVLANALAQP